MEEWAKVKAGEKGVEVWVALAVWVSDNVEGGWVMRRWRWHRVLLSQSLCDCKDRKG